MLAYFNSFGVPFHYDDIYYLRENLQIKSFDEFWNWLSIDYSTIFTGRAFLLFTFYLNYVINGLDVFGYHIVNLLIHISTAFLFYLLLAKYVYPPTPIKGGSNVSQAPEDITPPSPPLNLRGGWEGLRGGRGSYDFVAILPSTLFLLHPINTESVTYISSRSSVLSAFFMLASLLCFFRATTPQPMKGGSNAPSYPPLKLSRILDSQPRGGRGSYDGSAGAVIGEKVHAGFYALSIISFLLGLSTKESAIVTPALILLFDIYFISDKGKNIKSRLKYHLPFWIIIAAGFFYYTGYITSPAMYDRAWQTHILTEFKVFVEYLKLLILPLNLNIDHHIKASMTLDPSVIISIVVIAGLLLLAIFLKGKNKVLSFSILWFFLNLAPFMAIRLNDYMAERWVYTASLGFSLFISGLLMGLTSKYKRIGVFTITCVVISFGILTHMRNEIYKDPILLWTDAIEKSPKKIRPYTNLCASYVERQQMDKAVETCKTAIKKGSRQTETYINLATAYFFKNDLNNAESILLSMADAMRIKSDKSLFEIYHYNLGSIYKGKKEYNRAIGEYKEILKMSPQSPAALGLIAECYYRLGLKDKAEEYSYLATKGIPQNGEDYLMLAKSFLYLGENRKGIESLNKAIITDPLNGNIRYSVATLFLEVGNPDGAYKHFSVMAKLSPNYSPAYSGMGKAMLATGNLREASKHFNKALSLLPPGSPERKELLELLDKTKG
ncbi:MAG: hypothetical protein FD156_1279 [Nitrospirae bacterium]|nr:MAG: hypothetical protein FD156_1279 [Nitrospirota bacterium]